MRLKTNQKYRTELSTFFNLAKLASPLSVHPRYLSQYSD